MSRVKYSVKLLPAAENDLAEILEYIIADNPRAAEILLERIEKDIHSLSLYPYLGRIPVDSDIAEMGYRYLVVENYVVFYIIEDAMVYVHRILHGARDYTNIL